MVKKSGKSVKSSSKAPKVKTPTTKSGERKVLYTEVEAHVCGEGGDRPAIDAATAKEILGWQEEGHDGSNVKYGADYLLAYGDGAKVKVRCIHDVKNRPLYQANYTALRQEILNGRWRMNGEPIIISRTGVLLNGQHQLIGLVLADAAVRANPEDYPQWKGKDVAIEKVVVTGISDDDAVVDTMDTCKPRSLADVIFRSPYFANLKPSDRKKASRVTDYAIRFLWVRTAENLDGFSNMRTHSESVNFLERHPRLLEAVEFVMAEDSEGTLPNYISSGYAAGLMYLMAASATDTGKYVDAATRNEEAIDFSRWSEAEDFIVRVAAGNLDALRTKLASLIKDESDSRDARLAILIKAWHLHVDKEVITVEGLKLKYGKDDDGFPFLDDYPLVGGIDVGSVQRYTDEAEEPTPRDKKVAAKKAEVAAKKEKTAKATTVKATSKVPKEINTAKPAEKVVPKKPKTTKDERVGKAMWVVPSTEGKEPYRVKVLSIVAGHAKVRILQGFRGAGSEGTVPVMALQIAQPTPEPVE